MALYTLKIHSTVLSAQQVLESSHDSWADSSGWGRKSLFMETNNLFINFSMGFQPINLLIALPAVHVSYQGGLELHAPSQPLGAHVVSLQGFAHCFI